MFDKLTNAVCLCIIAAVSAGYIVLALIGFALIILAFATIFGVAAGILSLVMSFF